MLFSTSCPHVELNDSSLPYKESSYHELDVRLDTKNIQSARGRNPWDMPATPTHLFSRVAKLYSDPRLWWMSQLIKYLLRPNRNLTAQLEQQRHKLSPQVCMYQFLP